VPELFVWIMLNRFMLSLIEQTFIKIFKILVLLVLFFLQLILNDFKKIFFSLYSLSDLLLILDCFYMFFQIFCEEENLFT
jgi:hypothetical protein